MENKKTILSIVPSSNISGGAEKNLSHILEGYSNNGYHVILVIWNIHGDTIKQWQSLYNYEFYEVNKTGIQGLTKLIFLLKDMSKRNIDITFISNITLASIVGFLRNIKIYKTNFYIVRDPSSPFLRYKSQMKLLSYKLRYIIGYKAVDYLIFQTDLIQKAFYENLHLQTPSSVIENPVDLKDVHLKSALFVPNITSPYIVTCGRLIYEKGFDLLIKAFAKSDLKDTSKLIILGDGEKKEELHLLANSLGLSEKIVFLGFVENPMPYFSNAKGCIISSRSEGFPNVLYQMMALNNNVVMTRCCGNLTNIPFIKLVEADNVESLVNGLEYLSTNDSTGIIQNKIFLESKSISSFISKIMTIHAKL